MKYVATINGKKYEVEVEKLEAYKSLDRNGVAAPAAPAPAPAPAAPAPGSLSAPAVLWPGGGTFPTTPVPPGPDDRHRPLPLHRRGPPWD